MPVLPVPLASTGEYGAAPVVGFDIGNEYWASERMNALDGIIAHVFSRDATRRDANLPHSRYVSPDHIQDTWSARTPELEIHVTERNLRANSSSLIQNTLSALSCGFECTGRTLPGEMFSLMSANLPGMTMLDFPPDDIRDSELQDAEMPVHGFADGGNLLLYITAPQGGSVVQAKVDLRPLSQMSARRRDKRWGQRDRNSPNDAGNRTTVSPIYQIGSINSGPFARFEFTAGSTR